MALELQQIQLTVPKAQHQQRVLLQDFSLTVPPGEVVSLMGPSGCGKSTLLAYICGALPRGINGTGSVRINGEEISQQPLERRRIGLLFQSDLLFPHMSVQGNLAFALPAGLTKQERQTRIRHALEAAGLPEYGTMRPEQLSGGQRARISLMRTLLAEPRALLLDEPFSKLDSHLRGQIRDFVFDSIKARNIPALLVTHDLQDCGDTIVQLAPSTTDVTTPNITTPSTVSAKDNNPHA